MLWHLVGRYYVDTIKLILTFEKKEEMNDRRSYTHPKVVSDIVPSIESPYRGVSYECPQHEK